MSRPPWLAGCGAARPFAIPFALNGNDPVVTNEPDARTALPSLGGLGALERAWLDALATTDAGLLKRPLEWDGLTTLSEADLLTPPPPPGHAGQLAQIARWLQASKPIGTSDAFSATDVPFWEIWHRIASAAVVDVATRLPLDVASLFEADVEGWGRYRSVREELVGGFAARLAALGEAVFWEEFNRVEHRWPDHGPS